MASATSIVILVAWLASTSASLFLPRCSWCSPIVSTPGVATPGVATPTPGVATPITPITARTMATSTPTMATSTPTTGMYTPTTDMYTPTDTSTTDMYTPTDISTTDMYTLTESTRAGGSSISPSPPFFDIDLHRLAKVKTWHLKSLKVAARNAAHDAESCFYFDLHYHMLTGRINATIFKNGQSYPSLRCEKNSSTGAGALECFTDDDAFPFLPLGTNYETYFVGGLQGVRDSDGYKATMWCVFYSSRTPDTADLWKIEQWLKGVKIIGQHDVVEIDMGVSCPQYLSTAFPAPITSIPVAVSCLKRNFLDDFDLARYSGSWHDIMVASKPTPPTFVQCLTHVFATASNAVAYFEKTYSIRTGQFTTLQGMAAFEGPPGQGVFSLILPTGVKQTYRVVDTDYDSYSVIVSCNDEGQATETLRVLSRRYWLGKGARSKVNEVLRLYGVNNIEGEMIDLDTRPCIPDTCVPRGPAMRDFDALQFVGTWYLVKSLDLPPRNPPKCPTYLLAAAVNGSMFLQTSDARNSFSRPEMLEIVPVDLLSGEGRYVFRDRPGAPVRHYDILYASYQSWALVSACSDPPEDYRDNAAHNSLKIIARSRDPSQLPEKEVTDVLRDLDLDIIDFQSSDSVCDTLKCPLDVTTVEKFDRAKFQGTWVVLEETPTDTTTGFCTRHHFSKGRANKMTLDIHQYNSDGESVANRTYELDTVDPSEAKFTTEDPVRSGRDIFENYWVLDTDYKEFAVVYSCSDRVKGWDSARTWVLGRSTARLGHAAALRVLNVLTYSFVDMRKLREVDHHIAPCPQTPADVCPDDDDNGGGSPPFGPKSNGRRLAARAGLLAVSLATLVFVGIHARVGMQGLGLSMASDSDSADATAISPCLIHLPMSATDSPPPDSPGCDLPFNLPTGPGEVLERPCGEQE